MKMILYRYDGERNRLDKRSRMTGATETIDFNYIYESFDPAETDLKLKTNPTMSDVDYSMFNYASIGDNFYYVKPRYDQQGNLVFHIKREPLMTCREAIMKLQVQAVRSNKGDAGISTDNFTARHTKFVTDLIGTEWPGRPGYMLTCAGTAGSAPVPTEIKPTATETTNKVGEL